MPSRKAKKCPACGLKLYFDVEDSCDCGWKKDASTRKK